MDSAFNEESVRPWYRGITRPQWLILAVASSQWIPFPDRVEAYRLALSAGFSGFEIVTVVGESSHRGLDLSKAEHLFGFRPPYRMEEMGYTLGDEDVPL